MKPNEVKAVFERRGGHVHMTVFSRTPPTSTYANCGTLCFSVEEWPNILADLPARWLVTEKRG